MASTPFRRLFHWGPITVLCIIKLITWAMVHLLGMWWPPHESVGAGLHGALFLVLAASTLYYFLLSLLEGPGFVPLGWEPEREEEKDHLQYCTVCSGYKAPRSHHCRKCGYCIKKMDHHCPWINSCVGHANHGYFNMFLISAVFGCLQATIVLTICMYHAINRVWYKYNGTGREPVVYLTMTTLPLTLLAIGMALGVVLAVGALLYFQIKGILRNQTTIEDWIMEKAIGRREEQGLPPFVFPYDLGTKKNIKLVLFSGSDGLKWPVRDGCGEFDLTLSVNSLLQFFPLWSQSSQTTLDTALQDRYSDKKSPKFEEYGECDKSYPLVVKVMPTRAINQWEREQIAQKQDKRLRSRLYAATVPYSGRWVPLLQHPRAALAAPCTDEPRLALRPGDIVRVTRQRKHWLFGEKQTGAGAARGPRGWFPRAASGAAPSDTRKAKPD